jgi:hypothetical protein
MVVSVAFIRGYASVTVVSAPWTVLIIIYGIMEVLFHEVFMVAFDTGIISRDNELYDFFGVFTLVTKITDKNYLCILRKTCDEFL